jgi:hypothetical protein
MMFAARAAYAVDASHVGLLECCCSMQELLLQHAGSNESTNLAP